MYIYIYVYTFLALRIKVVRKSKRTQWQQLTKENLNTSTSTGLLTILIRCGLLRTILNNSTIGYNDKKQRKKKQQEQQVLFCQIVFTFGCVGFHQSLCIVFNVQYISQQLCGLK